MGFNVRYSGVFEGFGIATTMGGCLYSKAWSWEYEDLRVAS